MGEAAPRTTLRRCRQEDVAVLERHFPTGRNRYHEARYHRQSAGLSTFLIACLGDTPVGSGEVMWQGAREPDVRDLFPGCPEINGLAVLPERQSQGIGSALIGAAERLAARRGRHRIGIGVLEQNVRAAALYLRLGYRDTGCRYLDRYQYVDDHDVRHEVADPCRFLVKTMPALSGRPITAAPLTAPPRRRDPIKVVPYGARWPIAFAHQRSRIEAALGKHLVGRVEHVGSTAVPGLAAKPIIDMLALVEEYDPSAGIVAELNAIGWVHAPEPGDREQRKWSFCFPDIAWRTHHLHIWEQRSPHWRHLLRFRDQLRRHSDLAGEYARLKTELASADEHDRPRYRSGKAPFIQAVLRQRDVSTDAQPE